MITDYKVDGETVSTRRKASPWGLLVWEGSLVAFSSLFLKSQSYISPLLAWHPHDFPSSQGNFTSFSVFTLCASAIWASSLKCAKCSLPSLRLGICCCFWLKYASLALNIIKSHLPFRSQRHQKIFPIPSYLSQLSFYEFLYNLCKHILFNIILTLYC